MREAEEITVEPRQARHLDPACGSSCREKAALGLLVHVVVAHIGRVADDEIIALPLRWRRRRREVAEPHIERVIVPELARRLPIVRIDFKAGGGFDPPLVKLPEERCVEGAGADRRIEEAHRSTLRH